MPAIDALLRALARHEMDALVMAPGQRPVLRQADREHPVTKNALDAAAIVQLLAEISPPGTEPWPGGELGFDYSLLPIAGFAIAGLCYLLVYGKKHFNQIEIGQPEHQPLT